MKKTLLILCTSLIGVFLYAQNYNGNSYEKDTYYNGVENTSNMNITSDQKAKIIAIKKSIGRRHAQIGKSGLRGYEKGQAHRKLNLEIRKEISDVLNDGQRKEWGARNTPSSVPLTLPFWTGDNEYLEKQIDALEDKIDDMEDYYDRLIDAVDNDKSLSKAERKYKKNQLKTELKTKKAEMKAEKNALKRLKY